jgi:hypothetical protein
VHSFPRGVLWRRPQWYSAMRYVALLPRWVRELYCQTTYSVLQDSVVSHMPNPQYGGPWGYHSSSVSTLTGDYTSAATVLQVTTKQPPHCLKVAAQREDLLFCMGLTLCLSCQGKKTECIWEQETANFNEELLDLYCSPNIRSIIKSKESLVGYVAHVTEITKHTNSGQ